MAKKLKAAVIGCGRIGAEFDKDPKRTYVATHTGAYASLKDIDLVAVCDTVKERLDWCLTRWKIPKVYTDYNKMLQEEKIDIVSICTPPETHYKVLKDVSKYPIKAIFCEKPISDNVKHAEEMVRICKNNGIILQIDHQRRFDELHSNLKKMIEKKELGEVQQINFHYTAGIRNTGSHMFDLLRYLFGEVKWIEGNLSMNSSNNPSDPNIDGIICFRNGIFAAYQACNAKNYLLFELNCFFEKGRIVVKNSGFSLEFYKAGDSKYFSGYKEPIMSKAPFSADYPRKFMINAVQNIAKCVQIKKESISSGVDGLEDLKLIGSAVKSAKQNGKRIYL